MNTGSLRKRITIQQPVVNQQPDGENVQTWSDVQTVWGAIKPLSGRQLALAQASTITATATHEVTIRFNPLLKFVDRLMYGATLPLDETSLTAAEYADMTVEEYEMLTALAQMPPRYFRINAINDPEELHNEQVITCTEVKA